MLKTKTSLAMQKYYLFFVFLFVSLTVKSQHLDSIVTFKLNYLDEFVPSSKSIFNDDQYEKITISQYNENGIWINRSKTYYKYDSEGRELEHKTFEWNNGWDIQGENINSYSDTLIIKASYTYRNGIKETVARVVQFYENGILVEEQHHDGVEDWWTPNYVFVYYYENGDLIQKVHYKFNQETAEYERFWLYDDYYDETHNILQKNEYARSNGEWKIRVQNDFYYISGLVDKSIKLTTYSDNDPLKPSEKTEYSEHDTEKHPNVLKDYQWYSSSEQWILQGIDTLRYDQWGNVIVRASLGWNAQYDYFDTGVKYVYSYDEDGENAPSLMYKWFGFWDLYYGSLKVLSGDSTVYDNYYNYINDSKSVYIYNNDLLVRSRRYEKSGFDWLNTSLSRYYYSGITAVELLKSPEIIIYPNPTNGIVFVTGNPAAITVLNINGKVLFQDINTNSINLQNYPEGIYLIKINEKVFKVLKR